jgi:hypothetical protein
MLAGAVIAAALVLAGCGGGDDGGGASEEEFIAEVDAVCTQTSEEIEALYAESGDPSNVSQLDALLAKRLPISEQAQEQVEAIEPPDELADEYDQYLSQRREFISLLQEQKQAAERGDDARAAELDREIAKAGQGHTLTAGELGLEFCAGKPVADDEAFAAELDDVCLPNRRRVVDLFEQRGNPRNLPEYAAIFPERIAIASDRQKELSEIDPPEKLTADFRKLIEGGAAELAAFEALLAAAEANDEKAFGNAVAQSDQALVVITDAGAALGSYACAGELPSDQDAELRATIEDIRLNADPAHCTEDYTSDFVEELGGQEACEQSEKPAIEADSVEIGDIGGVDHIDALVDVTVHGGSRDGETATELYIYQEGRWKLDALDPLE